MAISVDDTVARWTGEPATSVAITSASFTPPNNSLLVVCANADENDDSANVVVSVSGGGLTWSQQVRRGATEAGAGIAAIWTAPVSTGASMQVSLTRTSGNGGTNRLSAKVYIVTGQHASPIGNSNSANWTTNPQTLAVTAAGAGRMFGCGTDWNATGTPVSTDIEDGAHYVNPGPQISVMSAYKSADHASGSQSIQFDPVGTPTGNVVVLEILAGAGGAISGTATWTWGQSGTLRGAGALSGTATWTWSQSGTLRGSGALSGTIPWAWSQSGSLVGSGALAGTAAWTWSQTGDLKGAGALSGTASWTWSQSGDLTNSTPAAGEMSGTATWTWGQSGDLKGDGALVGTVAWTWGQSATLSGAGALAGTIPWTWGQSGTLRGSGALAATAAWTWGQAGDLINLTPTGEISGTASWTWGQSGTLTNLTPVAPVTQARGGDDVPPHPRYEIHEKPDTRHKKKIKREADLTAELQALYRKLTGAEDTREEAEEIVAPLAPQIPTAQRAEYIERIDADGIVDQLRSIAAELRALEAASIRRREAQAARDDMIDLDDIETIREILDQL